MALPRTDPAVDGTPAPRRSTSDCLQIPTVRNRPSIRSGTRLLRFRGRRLSVDFPGDLVASLKNVGTSNQNCPPFHTPTFSTSAYPTQTRKAAMEAAEKDGASKMESRPSQINAAGTKSDNTSEEKSPSSSNDVGAERNHPGEGEPPLSQIDPNWYAFDALC